MERTCGDKVKGGVVSAISGLHYIRVEIVQKTLEFGLVYIRTPIHRSTIANYDARFIGSFSVPDLIRMHTVFHKADALSHSRQYHRIF
jgi:hypothetical protein